MTTKEQCAFLRNGTYCLMHKCNCCVSERCPCKDAIRRVHFHPKQSRQEGRTYDRSTVKGRMEYNTRRVCRGVVYSQCTGKTRYANEKRATEVARLRMRHGSLPLRTYYCAFCGGYHLTHKVQKEQLTSSAA